MAQMIISAVLLVASMFFPYGAIKALIFSVLYLTSGGETAAAAVKHILKTKLPDVNFLIIIAALGAVLLGRYTEAAAVMMLYRIGGFFSNPPADAPCTDSSANSNISAVCESADVFSASDAGCENGAAGQTADLPHSSAAAHQQKKTFPFMKLYPLAAGIAAAAAAVIPAVIYGGNGTYAYRALAFLVILCPSVSAFSPRRVDGRADAAGVVSANIYRTEAKRRSPDTGIITLIARAAAAVFCLSGFLHIWTAALAGAGISALSAGQQRRHT